MKRTITITVFLLFLFAPITFNAQSASELGLVLTGRRTAIKVFKRDGVDFYACTLRMVFENKGSAPVIIINPTLGYGTGLKEIIYYFLNHHNYNENIEGSRKIFEANVEKQSNLKSMTQFFDGARPSENMTIILKPPETFDFEENYEIERKFSTRIGPPLLKLDKVAGKTVRVEGIYYPEAAKEFRLVYEFSFLTYASDPELLEKLSLRWRKFGTLPVGPNGTYTITSEPIKQ